MNSIRAKQKQQKSKINGAMSKRKIDVLTSKELAQRIHEASVSKGFWNKDLPLNHHIMLVICELGEVVEAERRGRYATKIVALDYMYEHAYPFAYEHHIHGTVESELADVAMRLLDIIAKMGWMMDDQVCPENISLGDDDSLPLLCYSIIENLVCREFGDRYAVLWAFYGVLAIAHRYNIDLLNHIEMKMRYNKTRPMLNGKRY